MKINCAIIVSSLEEKNVSLNKFEQIENKVFFTFDDKIKSLHFLKSKKNFFHEMEMFFNEKPFFILHPDEEIILWDEEEIFKSHHNFIIDKWVIKAKRSNSKKSEVSKIFIKSCFKNIKKFENEWQNLYSDDNNFLARLQEYIFINEPEINELFLIYQYVYEMLKNKKHAKETVDFIKNIIEKHPTFVELINLWADYLYEMNMFTDARKFYENAIKMSEYRQIYDFMPMIPNLHKKHPEKMLNSIHAIIEKYDIMSK